MKKKIFALVLCVALLAVAIVGGTLAYFTDTASQKNTFTAGKVDISLTEKSITQANNGTITYGDRTSSAQSYKLYPGMTVTKDPTIKVETNSEEAYVGAIVTVNGNIHGLIGADRDDGVSGKWDSIDITKLVSGGIMSSAATQKTNWNGLSMVYENNDCVVYQDYSQKADNQWTIYVFVKGVKQANNSVVLFDTLTIPDTYGNEDMAKLNGTTVEVQAFATQTYGFGGCFEALTKAFPDNFNFSSTTTTP